MLTVKKMLDVTYVLLDETVWVKGSGPDQVILGAMLPQNFIWQVMVWFSPSKTIPFCGTVLVQVGSEAAYNHNNRLHAINYLNVIFLRKMLNFYTGIMMIIDHQYRISVDTNTFTTACGFKPTNGSLPLILINTTRANPSHRNEIFPTDIFLLTNNCENFA